MVHKYIIHTYIRFDLCDFFKIIFFIILSVYNVTFLNVTFTIIMILSIDSHFVVERLKITRIYYQKHLKINLFKSLYLSNVKSFRKVINLLYNMYSVEKTSRTFKYRYTDKLIACYMNRQNSHTSES